MRSVGTYNLQISGDSRNGYPGLPFPEEPLGWCTKGATWETLPGDCCSSLRRKR